MLIHTDVLTRRDFMEALPPGVSIDECEELGSRSRQRAFQVRLVVWDGGKGTSHPYRRNTGHHGAEDSDLEAMQWAATYDEWGVWLDELFTRDPEMIAGQYKGKGHYHELTERRYAFDRDAVTA